MMTLTKMCTHSATPAKPRRKREVAVELAIDIFKPAAAPGQAKGYILVVDDCLPSGEILGRMLVDAGYKVAKAANGRDALELAWFTQPDLILLDTSLPDISSAIVCGALRQKSRTRDIPIILMSVLDEVGILGAAIGADFMALPVMYDDLQRRVEARLGAKSAYSADVRARSSASRS